MSPLPAISPSAAIGSDIVTADALDADNLRLGTRLNGETMQDGNTRDMIFGIAEMLYEQQRDWIGNGQDPVAIADRLRKIGKVAGLEDEQLEACLTDNQKAKTLVAWYQENAEADDVTSTPTLVINGEQHSNMAYDELKEVLDTALGE